MYIEGNLANIYYDINKHKLILKIKIKIKINVKTKTKCKMYLLGYYKSTDTIYNRVNLQTNSINLQKTKKIKSFKSKYYKKYINYYFIIKKDYLPIDYAFVKGSLTDPFNENNIHIGKSLGYKLKFKDYEFNILTSRLNFQTVYSNNSYGGQYSADNPSAIFLDEYGNKLNA